MKNFKKTLRRVMSHPLLNMINHSNSYSVLHFGRSLCDLFEARFARFQEDS